MFSSRLPARHDVNAISRALEARLAAGRPLVDLTESNPTRVGLTGDAVWLDALANPGASLYAPDPFGLPTAREAVASDAARRGARLDPGHIVLTSSTSEAYSWLFKLLCSPGEAVLVPQPSYPLFDHLTALDGVRALPYRLTYHGRWDIDWEQIDAAPPHTRALLIVSPNNPTGSMVSADELSRLAATCARRGWALIADEVFADYTLEADHPLTDLAARLEVLTFSLGGASKSLGLPQVKLGWIVVGGPPSALEAALEALALIADTYLSVSTPVQVAAPSLFAAGARIREAIHDRVRGNLAAARRLAGAVPACSLLRVDGGWSLVVRVPAVRSEEALVLHLIEDHGILVHPGYFFDFAREAFVVVSLLPPEPVFSEAFARLLRIAA
jgi:alanine-synthesizing transaminase